MVVKDNENENENNKKPFSISITLLGIIQTLKNIGLFLATYQIAGIQADPTTFMYAFLIYCLVSVPSDLYLLNKAHEGAKKKEEEAAPST